MATQVIECGAACTVTVQLQAASPTSDNIADIGTVFSLFFGAVIAIYCIKQLLKFFGAAPHAD